MKLPFSYGISEEEKSMVFPCDELDIEYDPSFALYRGITINAEPDVIFKWLCQMRYGTYSYGMSFEILGGRCPTKLVPDQPDLSVGQSAMIFEVASFEQDRHLTLSIKPGSLYPVTSLVVCYLIVPNDSGQNRLLFKLVGKCKSGPFGSFAKRFLPWGNLIMMRKQLKVFKHFSEKVGFK